MKLNTEDIAQNLRDAGCPEKFIQRFLATLAHGTPAERERMLEQERRCILEKVHDEQKRLYCFDYLRYALKKEQEKTI